MEIKYQTVKAQVKLNPVFKEINQSKKRYRVFMGSAGSGKSVNVASNLIKKLSNPKYTGSNLMCIRKVEATNRDSTFAELKKAIREIYKENADKVWKMPDSRTSTMYLKCLVTGAEVIFRGCYNQEDIEKIKSVTFEQGDLTDIWIEEGTEIQIKDFEILDDRLRGKLPDGLYYQINITFNPISATHWLKKRFFDRPDSNAIVNHSTYLDNRFIDEAFHIRMLERKERDPEGYLVYGLGEWGSVGGVIFHNWEVKEFDTDNFNVRYYGQDFGFNHANCLLDICFMDDDIYICREMYVREKDTAEIIQMANEQGWNKNIEMFCDSANPDKIVMWQKAGYKAKPVKKSTAGAYAKAQIDWLKGVISKDKVVKRRIYIHPSCVNTIKEISEYRWKLDRKSGDYMDEPIDVHDDAMASLRYGIERLREPKPNYGFF